MENVACFAQTSTRYHLMQNVVVFSGMNNVFANVNGLEVDPLASMSGRIKLPFVARIGFA